MQWTDATADLVKKDIPLTKIICFKVLDDGITIEKGSQTIELYFQLSKSRLIHVNATIRKDNNNKFILNNQFVHLAPMRLANSSSCCAASFLVEDVDDTEFKAAISLVNGKDVTDLLKTYGPNEDSLLMTLCCRKNDSSSIRGQIFGLVARILDEANGKAIANIIQNNANGLTALDYTMAINNARIAAFLAEVFYIFGQDVLGTDNQVG
jgi:hypothetical protein